MSTDTPATETPRESRVLNSNQIPEIIPVKDGADELCLVPVRCTFRRIPGEKPLRSPDRGVLKRDGALSFVGILRLNAEQEGCRVKQSSHAGTGHCVDAVRKGCPYHLLLAGRDAGNILQVPAGCNEAARRELRVFCRAVAAAEPDRGERRFSLKRGSAAIQKFSAPELSVRAVSRAVERDADAGIQAVLRHYGSDVGVMVLDADPEDRSVSALGQFFRKFLSMG